MKIYEAVLIGHEGIEEQYLCGTREVAEKYLGKIVDAHNAQQDWIYNEEDEQSEREHMKLKPYKDEHIECYASEGFFYCAKIVEVDLLMS